MATIPAPVSVASVAKPAPGKLDAAVDSAAKAPAQPKEAKQPKAPKGDRKGRNSALSAKVITLNEAAIRAKMPEGRTELNPKREGTKGYKAFSLYKNGQTVAEFVKLASETKTAEGDAVGGLADVRWDSEHGFIELKDVGGAAPAPVAETKPEVKAEAPKA